MDTNKHEWENELSTLREEYSFRRVKVSNWEFEPLEPPNSERALLELMNRVEMDCHRRMAVPKQFVSLKAE